MLGRRCYEQLTNGKGEREWTERHATVENRFDSHPKATEKKKQKPESERETMRNPRHRQHHGYDTKVELEYDTAMGVRLKLFLVPMNEPCNSQRRNEQSIVKTNGMSESLGGSYRRGHLLFDIVNRRIRRWVRLCLAS